MTLVQSSVLNFRALRKHLRNLPTGWLQTSVWAVESKQKHRWNLNTEADVNFLSYFQMQIGIFSTKSQPSAAGSRFMSHPSPVHHDTRWAKETCPLSSQIHSGHKAWIHGFPAADAYLFSTMHLSSRSCSKWPRSVRPCLSSLILKTPTLESFLHSSIYFSPQHFLCAY